MSLDDLLREVITTGKLNQPFTAGEARQALSLEQWPLPRIQSFLVRHCMGNLAATTLLVERVGYGKYKLIYDGPRGSGGDHRVESPISPGDPES